MAIAGLITNEGLMKCIEAASNGGWHIYPTGFSVSDTVGDLLATRTYDSMNNTWFSAEISGRIVIDVHTIEFLCTIPPNSTIDANYIREVYITAVDENNKPFLLAIGQSKGDAIYDPSGTVKLRLQIAVQNLDMVDLLVFKYTQAQEIFDHNNDPNAHPSWAKKLADAIETHNLDPTSHPYILALIAALAEKLQSLTDKTLLSTGIVIPAITNLELGRSVKVIAVNTSTIDISTQVVSNRDAKGILVRAS
jgi:hypothetical protein